MSISARRLSRAMVPEVDDFILGVTIPVPGVNVGVYSSVARTAYSGPTTITTNGMTIQNQNITQYIDVNAKDVTFINCYFSAGGDLSTGGMVNCKSATCENIRFSRCTFMPATMSDRRDAVYGHDYTAERCHIERTVDGFAVANQYAAAANVHLLGNWIGNLAWYNDDRQGQGNGGHNDGTHNDGVQIHSGTNIHIQGNAFYGYKFNALGTPALDSSADNRYPQIGQILMASTAAYYHVGDVHFNSNFIWGGDNGVKTSSKCSIHNSSDAAFDLECRNNTWMDDNQRDYGYTWKFYLIRTDNLMTINGRGPFTTSPGSATYDLDGNKWSATSPDVSPARRGQAVFVRADPA